MSKVVFDRKCDIERFFGNRHDLNVRCGIEIAAKSDVDRSGTKSFLLAILSHADEDDLRKRDRSEEHTSELQSLMRISYAVFCLKKKPIYNNKKKRQTQVCTPNKHAQLVTINKNQYKQTRTKLETRTS